MYDWIRHSKKAFKGAAQTLEVYAFVPFTKDKKVGAFLGLDYMTRKLDGYESKTLEESPYEHKETFYPPPLKARNCLGNWAFTFQAYGANTRIASKAGK